MYDVQNITEYILVTFYEQHTLVRCRVTAVEKYETGKLCTLLRDEILPELAKVSS